MKKSSIKAIYAFIALLSLVISSSYAQFSYDKVEDDYGLDIEKRIAPYWSPRYNRVEGVFLNIGARLRPQIESNLHFYGDVGVGFWNQSNKQFRFTAGFRKDFFDIKRLSIGAEVFRDIDSKDNWLVSSVENTITSLLFRQDYKDYYGTHGFKIYLDHKYKGLHTLRLEIGRRTYDAFQKNINWSLFKGDFENNPARNDYRIAEGDEIDLKFIAAFDWRDNPIFPLSGWFVEAIYERTFEDFDTDGIFLSVKRYQQTFGNQRLFLRGMLGLRRGNISIPAASISQNDSLAAQYFINIGGVGSLRGYDDWEFSGNRMFMLNANYIFGGDLLQKIPLQNVPVFGAFWTAFSAGLFLDTGWAWKTDDVTGSLFTGFNQLKFGNLKTDVGLSIFVLEGVFRLDIAKRLDRSHDDFRVTFRLLEKF